MPNSDSDTLPARPWTPLQRGGLIGLPIGGIYLLLLFTRILPQPTRRELFETVTLGSAVFGYGVGTTMGLYRVSRLWPPRPSRTSRLITGCACACVSGSGGEKTAGLRRSRLNSRNLPDFQIP